MVIGPANHSYAWVALVKEHCTAMVLRESILIPQCGSRNGGLAGCGSRNRLRKSSKDQNSQTTQFELQECLWLIWSFDPGCVSYRTCGYRTRKPPLYLSERRLGALHCNGFRVSSPMLQCGLRKWRGALGVVLGTSQYIVMCFCSRGNFV